VFIYKVLDSSNIIINKLAREEGYLVGTKDYSKGLDKAFHKNFYKYFIVNIHD
jgi:D-serine dehydratase